MFYFLHCFITCDYLVSFHAYTSTPFLLPIYSFLFNISLDWRATLIALPGHVLIGYTGQHFTSGKYMHCDKKEVIN